MVIDVIAKLHRRYRVNDTQLKLNTEVCSNVIFTRTASQLFSYGERQVNEYFDD